MTESNSVQLQNRRWYAKVIKKNGSDKLYIKLFYHRSEPFVRSTYLVDNEDNRKKVGDLVARINTDLQAGTFNFAKAFPGASEEDQKFFAKKEKRHFSSPPEVTTFKAAYDIWEKERLPQILHENTREDYMKAINPHILPFFRDLTFDEIDEEKVKEFFKTRYLYGNPENGLVSKKRMFNIRIPLIDIWNFTVKRMKWEVLSPFTEDITETIVNLTSKVEIPLSQASLNDRSLLEDMLEREEKKSNKAERKVMLFADYSKVLSCLDPFYVPDIELMMLTGISSSEMAGLHIYSRKDDNLCLQWSISDMRLRDRLKTNSRLRDIPITTAINRVIDAAMKKKRPDAIFIFQSVRGLPHNNQSVRKAWYRACDKAKVNRVCPYSLRHSFVAYCKLMGITEPRMVGLMGHANQKMINEIYGKYAHGTEKEIEVIKQYFGEDFWGK